MDIWSILVRSSTRTRLDSPALSLIETYLVPMSLTCPVNDSLEIRSLIVGVAARRSDAFLAHPSVARLIAMTDVSIKTISFCMVHLLPLTVPLRHHHPASERP